MIKLLFLIAMVFVFAPTGIVAAYYVKKYLSLKIENLRLDFNRKQIEESKKLLDD